MLNIFLPVPKKQNKLEIYLLRLGKRVILNIGFLFSKVKETIVFLEKPSESEILS